MKTLLLWTFSFAVFLAPLASAQAQKPPQVNASDCETCLRTCPGTCAKHGDSCFCYQTLEPDKNVVNPIPLPEDPGLKGGARKQPPAKPGAGATDR